MLCANSPEAFRIIAIMAGGAFTRACLGSSNSHLKRLGERLTEVCYIHSRHNFTIDLQHVKSQYDDKKLNAGYTLLLRVGALRSGVASTIKSYGAMAWIDGTTQTTLIIAFTKSGESYLIKIVAIWGVGLVAMQEYPPWF